MFHYTIASYQKHTKCFRIRLHNILQSTNDMFLRSLFLLYELHHHRFFFVFFHAIHCEFLVMFVEIFNSKAVKGKMKKKKNVAALTLNQALRNTTFFGMC